MTAPAASLPEPVREIARIAGWIYPRGWAEANAGNMSLRIDRIDAFSMDREGVRHPLPTPMADLDGVHLVISGTGQRMREAPAAPEGYVGLIRVIEGGHAYRILWGAGPSTSELPAHLGIHAMAMAERPEVRAVIHTHPTNLVALSHHPDLQDEAAFNDALFRLHPETRVHLPGRLARLPYIVPGTAELGVATAEALRTRDVVLWSLHGVVAVADRLDRAFDRVEVLEKAAALYLLAAGTGRTPVGMTDGQIDATLKAFGLG